MVITRLLEFKEKATEWRHGAGAGAGAAATDGGDNPPSASAAMDNTAAGAPSSSGNQASGPSPLSTTTTPSLRMAPHRLSGTGSSSTRSTSLGRAAVGDDNDASYWTYATDSLHWALMGMVSSLYSDRGLVTTTTPFASSSYDDNTSSLTTTTTTMQQHQQQGTTDLLGATTTPQRRTSLTTARSTHTSSWRPSLHRGSFQSTQDLALGGVFENPYSSVRGRQPGNQHRSSARAVRSLLALVPVKNESNNIQQHVGDDSLLDDPTQLESISENVEWTAGGSSQQQQRPLALSRTSSTDSKMASSSPAAAAETASQLAEGTIRALRDTALDEAVELQQALRFWNDRWESPLLSWLEAGPWVWWSAQGYSHQHVAWRVAQLQAVLARRCAAIGELQQHLLRAGWQQGVAQWGVLHGGEWAPVAGFSAAKTRDNDEAEGEIEGGVTSAPAPAPPLSDRTESPDLPRTDSSPPPSSKKPSKTNRRLSRDIGDVQFDPQNRLRPTRSTYKAKVLVQKNDGGGLFVDDPGFFAEWSVEAMLLIRKHLFRAGNGMVLLPYESNWNSNKDEKKDEDDDDGEGGGTLITGPESGPGNAKLPSWASETIFRRTGQKRAKLEITNLPLMAAEVEMLLDVMEDIMAIQRQRRLDRLQEPGRLRRNWYIVASLGPTVGALLLYMARYGRAGRFVGWLHQTVSSFIKERLSDPVTAICNELLKGRESFADKKARMDATETLKTMIRSFLDDFYPDMPESERISRADALDISLIELKKEESMKTFYEINNVVRMSFIEMQFLKKELMNSLHAIDEMMGANDVNMNIAAITPAVLVAYAGSQLFRFFYYALLKLGKSREETYASFRETLTDIERLLVMRDNPPRHPPPRADDTDGVAELDDSSSSSSSHPSRSNGPCQLGPDDLGMVLLLVHECRGILWRDSRRFSKETIKSVSEDLAELAGERGAVSVQQQLKIIARMCRTYPFLKVISTGLFRRSRGE